MRLPKLRFTVRRMMVGVAIVALAMFVFEAIERRKIRFVDANSGRFLVLVKTFRGQSARSEAGVLANELRHRYGLPSYILAASDIRRRQPSLRRGRALPGPATEEVAVLIGDCETKEDCAARREQLRRIKSGSDISWVDRLRPYHTANNPYLPQSTTFGQQQSGQE